jgi:hypothetical protein
MPRNPALFVRVSTPAGHFSVPTAVASKAGSAWRVLKQDAVDKDGRPLPHKLRSDIAAATPAETEPETTDVSADTEESE